MIKIAEKLEKYLQEYDKVIVLRSEHRTNEILSHITSRQPPKKLLVLVSGGNQDKIISGADIRAITYKEYCNIAKLYHMYEFSDRIWIVADNKQCGCLDNYVGNNLLTEEEALMALLR